MIQFSIAKIGITTHTMTSTPIPITHPTAKKLIPRFPLLFGLFVKSAEINADGVTNDHPIIYPPHLSLFAPSLVFRSLYHILAPFHHPSKEGDQTYNIPTAFPHLFLEIHLTEHGMRRIRDISLALVDASETPRRCAPIHIEAVEISGRDTDGKGGCCTLHIRDAGNRMHRTGNYNNTSSTMGSLSFPAILLRWIM